MFREIAVFQLWMTSNFCTRELFRYISCFISVYLQEFSDEKYLPQDEIWLYDPECCTWYVPVCRYIINVYLSLLLVDIFYFSFIIQHGAVAAGYHINQIFMPPAVQLLRFENTKILIAVLVTKFVACYLL